MSRERAKGPAFETALVRHLRERLGDDRIDRMPLHGSKDMGDVAGVYRNGRRVVVECKSCRRVELAQWVDEAEAERANADGIAGVVVFKRRGVGLTRMGEQYALMQVNDLVALIEGVRGDEE